MKNLSTLLLIAFISSVSTLLFSGKIVFQISYQEEIKLIDKKSEKSIDKENQFIYTRLQCLENKKTEEKNLNII